MTARSITFFSARIDALTAAATVALIESRIDANTFTQHSVVNVAKIVNMHRDVRLADAVNACDIVNVDGMGVVWGARVLGYDIPERVTGVDLFGALLEMAAGRGFPVYLLGAREHVVAKVADMAANRYPGLRIAGFHHGYFWDDELAMVDKIRTSGAKLLFVAITSPHKEIFIDRWRDQLGVSFVMGVGGTFDVVAGHVRRAPRWMQQAGLEWLFRVIQEPRRMWRRYLTTNAYFAYMMMRAKLNSIVSR
ncbi:N-acetylglucosaminyldiphosphoundecaprenol N-acetyl-beta-D-mannosaminyltransferase [Paraburkholderia nemoris]|uniref:WecB/TagA/CpsF family glycosyltransferase n=1 Tax=Paraburkholderia nemoris TaxID=2793076 RepID=UPI00190969BD|nr:MULTISPECIES: WecB/TagA/CpsF family glycosyltransferase [Paraburkholderia]MBK3786700.1 WecB/TagA/CpsF family glycosyltransferase [Paraburkholderia aspalathi]CAE6845027.1 N-acetylglucosaminyldiphosphoundecaprenol N-acetyl-beta-D-mannosaminyltransferase [Paraburkholderia nemoris]